MVVLKEEFAGLTFEQLHIYRASLDKEAERLSELLSSLKLEGESLSGIYKEENHFQKEVVTFELCGVEELGRKCLSEILNRQKVKREKTQKKTERIKNLLRCYE